MIALHLDATYADHNTWREFASCFLKLLENEEDRMSWCQNGNGSGLEKKCSVSFNEIPNMFKEGKSRKNWRLRCKWWLTRHFSRNTLASEIAAGNFRINNSYQKSKKLIIHNNQVAFFLPCIVFQCWSLLVKQGCAQTVKCISESSCA